MAMQIQNELLRRDLQEITDTYIGEKINVQIEKIEALKSKYPHSIRLLRPGIIGDSRSWVFNCHAFSFGLINSEDYWKLQNKYWPNGEFVKQYLLPVMQLIDKPNSEEIDIVIYSQGEQIKHSAIIHENLCQSKWGTAHTWEHNLFEVPLSCGDTANFYRRLSDQTVLSAYFNYAGAG